jgi:hypothetical protein
VYKERRETEEKKIYEKRRQIGKEKNEKHKLPIRLL